jgi:hypothetical protein
MRRAAVIAAFGGYPLLILGYGTLVEPGRISTIVWGPIAVALFTLTIVGTFALYGYGQGRMGYPKRALDERQRAMHDRALVVSYGVATIVFGLMLGGLAGAALQGPVVVEMADLTPVLIAAGLYLPLLPFASLAWIEPNLPADDEG